MSEDSEKKQLGRIALKQRAVKGGLSPELEALRERFGVPAIDLSRAIVPAEVLALIPDDIARQHTILPIRANEAELELVMLDPRDRRIIEEIEFVTGRRVSARVTLEGALREGIEAAYRAIAGGAAEWRGAKAQSMNEISGLTGEPTPPKCEGEAFRASNAPEAGAFQSRRERPTNPKVLIVDDEEDIRKLLSRVLGKKGYQPIEAGDGQEALSAVREHSPDVILLDAMLPEVHGFDICRRIKGSKRYGHIPIIMVSAIYRGWRFAEDLRASYGIVAFLEKPFKINEIIDAVEAALVGSEPVEDEEAMSEEATAHLEAGMKAYRSGALEEAIQHLHAGLEIDPLSFQLHYHLGLLYGRAERLFDAIHELETAVDLQSRNFSALKNLAVLYQRAGFRYKSIEMWERALTTAPDEDTRQGIKEHLMTLL